MITRLLAAVATLHGIVSLIWSNFVLSIPPDHAVVLERSDGSDAEVIRDAMSLVPLYRSTRRRPFVQRSSVPCTCRTLRTAVLRFLIDVGDHLISTSYLIRVRHIEEVLKDIHVRRSLPNGECTYGVYKCRIIYNIDDDRLLIRSRCEDVPLKTLQTQVTANLQRAVRKLDETQPLDSSDAQSECERKMSTDLYEWGGLSIVQFSIISAIRYTESEYAEMMHRSHSCTRDSSFNTCE